MIKPSVCDVKILTDIDTCINPPGDVPLLLPLCFWTKNAAFSLVEEVGGAIVKQTMITKTQHVSLRCGPLQCP